MFRYLGKSKIAFILAILFGISIFFIGGNSRYSNFFNSDSVAAKVSNTPISTTKFNRTMQMNINKFNQMLNKQMTGDEIRSFQIHSLALGALVNDAAFENEYDIMNFKIDEKVIALKTKEKIPQLYDDSNKLNELYLETFLKQQQLQIEDIVQIISFETRDNYFNQSFFKINYPQYFQNKINSFDNQKREVQYIELDIDKIPNKEIELNNSKNINEELEQFYNKNVNAYMDNEKRSLEYILIDKNILRSKFQPSEFDIEEYYKLNKKLFFENESRSFIQFNFKTIEEANKIKEDIKNFDLKSILEYSDNNNLKFNEFDKLESDEIFKEISDPLFKLEINQHSDIIETSIAKHLIILKSIHGNYQKKLEEVNELIKESITKIDSNNSFNDLNDKISNEILNGNKLSEIANSNNQELVKIKDLTRDFKEYDPSYEPFFNSLIKSAFESKKDFVSNIINVNQDLIYAFNITNIKPSEPLDFTEIKKRIKKDWESFKKIEKIELEIKENKQENLFISNLGKRYKLDTNNIKISSNSNELPNTFLKKIFNSQQNNLFYTIEKNKFYIGKVKEILMPETIDKSNLISIDSDLRGPFASEIMKNKKVVINDNLINAIIEQY